MLEAPLCCPALLAQCRASLQLPTLPARARSSAVARTSHPEARTSHPAAARASRPAALRITPCCSPRVAPCCSPARHAMLPCPARALLPCPACASLPCSPCIAEPRRPARAVLPNPSHAALPHSPAPLSRPAATTASATCATSTASGGAAGSAGGAAGAGGAGGADESAGGAAGAGAARGGQQQSLPLPDNPAPQQLCEWVIQQGDPGGGGFGFMEAAALSSSESAAAPGASESAAALGASESADALGASASTATGPALAEALHIFTLDLGASRCFFCDCTTVTPLAAPVPVSLADPTGGPVVARASTVLACLAVPSGSLSGLLLPAFSTNLLSNAVL
ncbi:unnamed protein product [Closterium sp. NIES-54]